MAWHQKGVCVQCGEILVGRKTSFCSAKCGNAHNAEKWRKMNGKRLPIPSATVGAIGEYLVGIDLMKRGHHVFRALSPSSPGDLAVLIDKRLVLIEVTTGSRSITGKLSWAPHLRHKETYDVIAIVEHCGTITYIPELITDKPESADE